MASTCSSTSSDVQLERVGPRLLHELRVVGPPAGRRAVERGDDGDADRLLDALDLFEVAVRTEREFVRRRQISRGLGERVFMGVHVLHLRARLQGDLLLEERVHDDGRRTRILEAAHAVHAVNQGLRPGQQRVLQTQAEVIRGEVHGQAGSVAAGTRRESRSRW
jgi:hypothetical protein